MFSFQDKCVSYETFDESEQKHKTWISARGGCQSRGGDLVTLKTPEEMQKLNQVFRQGGINGCFYTGLQLSNHSVDSMYR